MNFMLLTKMVNVFIGPASPKKSFCHCFTTGLVAALAFHRALSTGEHAVQVFLISLGQCENFIGSPPPKKKNRSTDYWDFNFFTWKKIAYACSLWGLYSHSLEHLHIP